MALNVLHPDIKSLDDVLSSITEKVSDSLYRFKPEIGEGFFQFFERKNWKLYIGEFNLKQDVRIIREPDNELEKTYSISFRTFKEQLEQDISFPNGVSRAAEGIVLNSNLTKVNTLWHKNTDCRMVFLIFDIEWIELLEQTELLPNLVSSKLQSRLNPVFHIQLTPEIKQNLRQMLYTPSEIQGNFKAGYLYNKSVELFIQSASLAINRVEKQVRNLSIHPEDLNTLEQVKVQIINSYQEPPSVTDLVNQTGMSKSKLQRLFHKVYNNSVYQFIKQVRMEKAMELLMQGYSVTEAGYDVGYSSIPNFSVAFKEHFNMQPGQVASR